MTIQKEEFSRRISRYVPEESVLWVTDLVFRYGVGLTIKKGRKSKLGDYRAPFRNKGHRISINFELNKEEFLQTFIHEMAHLICFEKYRNNVLPHGKEWKLIYITLMKEAIQNDFFPEELKAPLGKHIQKPGATSCSDPELRKAMSKKEEDTILHDIEPGSFFKLGNMIFEKGPLQRTRYKCLNLSNQRHYLVQKHAPVEKIDHPDNIN